VLGCFAKTGHGVAVAVAAGPVLVGKWPLLLAPESQERFVYHAVQGMDLAAAEKFVAKSTRVVNAQTERAIRTVLDALAGLDVTVDAAAVVGRSAELPGPLEKIVAAHTLLHNAEGALYRGAIIDALDEHGVACALVPPDELSAADAALDALGKVPSPWRKEHKDAARAALTLVRAGGRGSGPRTAPAGPRRRRV
jgi:hypothetical protein